jgi:hypothetical protein
LKPAGVDFIRSRGARPVSRRLFRWPSAAERPSRKVKSRVLGTTEWTTKHNVVLSTHGANNKPGWVIHSPSDMAIQLHPPPSTVFLTAFTAPGSRCWWGGSVTRELTFPPCSSAPAASPRAGPSRNSIATQNHNEKARRFAGPCRLSRDQSGNRGSIARRGHSRATRGPLLSGAHL